MKHHQPSSHPPTNNDRETVGYNSI